MEPLVLVNDDELATCISILQRFHSCNGEEEFKKPRYKQLRKAILPLISDLRKKFFHGNSVDSDSQHQEKKRKLKIERARQKALDQQSINNTKLRAERLARLQELTSMNPLLAQVPDGASHSQTLLMDSTADTPQTDVPTDASTELHQHRACYTCKVKFKQLHHFYDRLCPPCAALNYQKRLQTANLEGHIAIVTGARVKIGYEIALKLLRAGAHVIATTRFPHDTVLRYAAESDFAEWKSRLEIYGLDFRDLGVIDQFMNYITNTFGYVDILINNATQTIRRPVHYYKHLLDKEVQPVAPELKALLNGHTSMMHSLEHGVSTRETVAENEGSSIVRHVHGQAVPSSVMLSQVALLPEDQEVEGISDLFPSGQVDNNKQQIDLRKQNTWVQKIDEIETMELVEVFAINTMAPFLLNKRVIPLLRQSPRKHRFIINVSAMEGKFYRVKTANHPHTNMAKAAANMMTRTCAEDLAKQGIYMNSVDTGWINDENPREQAVRIASTHNFQTPLDEIDAAARVLDPIFVLHQSDHKEPPMAGLFLKDYRVTEW